MKRLLTCESVAYGHPDKIADQIGDAILDALLEQDPNTKAGIEVMVKDNCVVLGGEIKTSAIINYDDIVKNTVKELNFSLEHGFHYSTLTIINLLGKQSIEINKAVELSNDLIAAGDQGFMVGFASNDTSNYMPLGIHLSKKIVDWVVSIYGFGPDAKSQITVEYDEINKNKRIHTIVVSTMFLKSISLENVRNIIKTGIQNNLMELDKNIFNLIDDNTKIIVNPSGEWFIGGTISDAGISGRKLIVDSYGAYCQIGGGNFSGKDYSKLDRSGAYLARYIAKNIVASNISSQCKVEIAYIIGVLEPISLNIDTFGEADDEKLINIIRELVKMTPTDICNRFDLKKPIYYNTSRHGHFGIADRPWEKLDLTYDIEKLYYRFS